MSDLISRSALLKYMENKEISQSIDELNDGNDNYSSTGLYDYVKEMPTAYDLDKVIMGLKCDECEKCNFFEVCAGSRYCEECHDKIIKIVKAGSVNDQI